MAKTPGRDGVISMILRSQQYKCYQCQINQYAMVVKQPDGSYFACDDFQVQYMKDQGRTPFKIYLRLNFRDGDPGNLSVENIFALCPACTANFLRDLKKDFRAEAVEKRASIHIGKIVEIKKFLRMKTGMDFSTRNILALIDLVTNNQ